VLVPGQQEHESGAAPRLAGQSGLFLDREREGDSPLTAPAVGRARHRRIKRVELGQRALQRRRAPQALARDQELVPGFRLGGGETFVWHRGGGLSAM
jgi:hypothetical protein